jgi:hypothetical protein
MYVKIVLKGTGFWRESPSQHECFDMKTGARSKLKLGENILESLI